jgi:hypothetical protein
LFATLSEKKWNVPRQTERKSGKRKITPFSSGDMS